RGVTPVTSRRNRRRASTMSGVVLLSRSNGILADMGTSSVVGCVSFLARARYARAEGMDEMDAIDLELIVRRDDPTECAFLTATTPSPREGEVLVKLEKFGLTSNNVTYAALGDSLPYLRFFPVFDPARAAAWGCPPVWGMARIVASNHEGLPVD